MEDFNEDAEIEKIKAKLNEVALRQEQQLSTKTDDNSVFGDSFSEFVKTDEKISKDLEKHNRKKFKIFKKKDQDEIDDMSAISRYQVRYDRETWFYKRHRDTIDKYAKRYSSRKQDKQKDDLVYDENADVLRVGYFVMLFYVWFDLIMSALSNFIAIPIHIVRVIAELFAKMKKEIMWATIIIMVVLIVVIGVIIGINSLLRFANSFQ